MSAPPWNPLTALTSDRRDRLAAFQAELLQFNRQINLVARGDETVFEERHLLHALALTLRTFPDGASVVDWGTGGGLPAVPLAIAFPGITVHAVDAVGKKARVVHALARRVGLDNLHAWHGRAEVWPGTASYSVSRATAPLADLWTWHRRVYRPPASVPGPNAWRPGLVCLKGGDLTDEIAALRSNHPDVAVEVIPLEPLLCRPYFAHKVILAVTQT